MVESPPPSLDLSIIVPVKDEAGNIEPLAREIEAALAAAEVDRWECIWVDDGSSDGTTVEVQRLVGREPRHRVVALDRNYGQSAALGAGFCAARGDLIATLDGDGQLDPADLPRLLELQRSGAADVVNGRRQRRQDGWLRRLSSRIGNGFRNRITGEQVADVGCSLRVMRRACVQHLLVFRGMHRFLPTLIRLNGYDRILEVPVRHRPRLRGQTKYGIRNRLWVGIQDTLAVRWLGRRLVAPRQREGPPDPTEG